MAPCSGRLLQRGKKSCLTYVKFMFECYEGNWKVFYIQIGAAETYLNFNPLRCKLCNISFLVPFMSLMNYRSNWLIDIKKFFLENSSLCRIKKIWKKTHVAHKLTFKSLKVVFGPRQITLFRRIFIQYITIISFIQCNYSSFLYNVNKNLRNKRNIPYLIKNQ